MGSHTLLTGLVAGQQIRVVAPSDLRPAPAENPTPDAECRPHQLDGRHNRRRLGRTACLTGLRRRAARFGRMTVAATQYRQRGFYPFQWNWDSAFVAMGWATFDAMRAWDEVDLLLRGQWDDGMIPQIIFHAPSDDYFPGPDVWRTGKSPQTSRHHATPGTGDGGAASGRPRHGRARRRCQNARRLCRPAPQPSLVASSARSWEHRAGCDAAPVGDGDGQLTSLGRRARAGARRDGNGDTATRHLAYRCDDAPAWRGVSALHPFGRGVCGGAMGSDPYARDIAVSAWRISGRIPSCFAPNEIFWLWQNGSALRRTRKRLRLASLG